MCILFIFSILLLQHLFCTVQGINPEVLLNFEQRVKFHGYPVEIHHVVTEDDYIITLYRIPHGLKKAQDEQKNKSAILIVHGMGGSAMNYITLGPKIAPAYYFADRGFDVWLICTRGLDCQNPKKHKRYDWNKDQVYWKFSFHEIGLYDVSSSVDHIIKITGQQKIFTIGHSAGAPALYILVTERPEYNKKIKIITNYGGATLIKHIDYPLLRVLGSSAVYFRNIISSLGLDNLIPQNIYDVIGSFTRIFCADPEFKKICFGFVPGLLGNFKTTLIEEDLVELLYSNLQRISLQQVMHYGFNLASEDFRKYDWGPRRNMKIYGQKNPPLYNISACTCASAFFYGVTDSNSTPEDNWATMDLLSNIILDYQIGPRFHHLDFIFASNASHIIYEPTVQLFNDYDQGKIPLKAVRTDISTNQKE